LAKAIASSLDIVATVIGKQPPLDEGTCCSDLKNIERKYASLLAFLWRLKLVGYLIVGLVAFGGFVWFCDYMGLLADEGLVFADVAEEEEEEEEEEEDEEEKEEEEDESFEIVPPFAI